MEPGPHSPIGGKRRPSPLSTALLKSLWKCIRFCVYHTESLLRLRRAVGEQISANLDPSHLIWQGMDPIAVIRALKGRDFFHFHAKDTKIDPLQYGGQRRAGHQALPGTETRSWNFRALATATARCIGKI